MIQVTTASPTHIKSIQAIAYKTWPATFGKYLSISQIAYMLEMMYSEESLLMQMVGNKHTFLLAKDDDDVLGYLSYELNEQNLGKLKIHKFYLLPQAQGKGVGKKLLEEAEKIALANGCSIVTLAVYKKNEARGFYLKQGFDIIDEELWEIGQGYLMEGYILEKKLNVSTFQTLKS